MFKEFFFKRTLFSQKKCLKALEFLLQQDNINIYNTAKGLINYHKSFLHVDINSSNTNPLTAIKLFYQRHKSYSEKEIQTTKDKERKNNLEAMLESDNMILKELTDDYINKFNKIMYNINIVKENKKSLNQEQEELLNKFNEIYNKNDKLSKVK